MVQRLENKIHSAKTRQEPVIDFEKNDSLKGLEHIDAVYQAIVGRQCIRLSYQSFKARESSTFDFHPYYLKEYRNRWFIIGVKGKDAQILNLALDRILSIETSKKKYVPRENFTISSLLNNVIGVSVNIGGKTEHIKFIADYQTAPYIITKPLHHSQQVVERLPEGVVFSIDVQHNFELQRELLGFGDKIRVLAPESLKSTLKQIYNNAVDSYQNEFNASSIHNNVMKLTHKGSTILHHVFRKKEVNAIKSMIHNHLVSTDQDTNPHAIRNVLSEIPGLKKLLFNSNIRRVIQSIGSKLFLTKAIYFDKTPESNWYVTWHQDLIINVTEKNETEGFSGWTKKNNVHGVCPPEDILRSAVTLRIHLDDAHENNGALKVIPGSHQKKLNDDEISLISQNASSQLCEVDSGCVHLMKPLILHASSKSTDQKHRRVIHLEFNSIELPNGLEWAERIELDQE